MPGTKSLLVFAGTLCLCVCWSTITCSYNSILAFYFLLLQSPTCGLKTFPGLSWASTQPCVCTWPSIFPKLYWIFSRSLWLFHSSTFPLSFWVSWLFAPVDTAGNCTVKQLLLIGFSKCFWRKYSLCWVSVQLGKVQLNFSSGIYQETDRTNNDNSQRMKLWKSFNTIWGWLGCLLYTIIANCWFPRLPWSQGEGDGIFSGNSTKT